MARVRQRLISLDVDGENRCSEVSKAVITSADGDFRPLCSVAGNRDYWLQMTIAQDHASGTLWDLIWTGTGTQVTGVYAPYGNTTATADQPHYTFTAWVLEPDGDFMGGESTASYTAVPTIDVSWPLDAKPVKVTSA